MEKIIVKSRRDNSNLPQAPNTQGIKRYLEQLLLVRARQHSQPRYIGTRNTISSDYNGGRLNT